METETKTVRADILTRFGGPRGNQQGNQSAAASQRAFYRWVECEATEEELVEYANNGKNPLIRRKFIECFVKANSIRDFLEVTNQTHGMPKQVVEQVAPPVMVVNLGNVEDAELLPPDDWGLLPGAEPAQIEGGK